MDKITNYPGQPIYSQPDSLIGNSKAILSNHMIGLNIVTIIAWQQHKFITAIAIILSVVSIMMISSFYIKKLLANLTTESKSFIPQNPFARRFSIVYFSIFFIIFFIKRRQVF